MRVFIGQDYYYPDLVIVCDEARYADSQRDVLLNPRVVIEVLSPSTASFDRGTKFANYRGIDSLMEYLLISQDKIRSSTTSSSPMAIGCCRNAPALRTCSTCRLSAPR